MTVHRERNMKREDQQGATIRCLLLTSVSTCFGHHYAHLQENKSPVTAFGVLCVETEVNNKHLIVAPCWSSLFIFCSRCTVIGT